MLRQALCTLHGRRALWAVAQEAVAAVGAPGTKVGQPCLVSLVSSHQQSSCLHTQDCGGHQLPQQVPWRACPVVGHRALHTTPAAAGSVVSFPLAQTGEGISECELMQWFVKASQLPLTHPGWLSRTCFAVAMKDGVG